MVSPHKNKVYLITTSTKTSLFYIFFSLSAISSLHSMANTFHEANEALYKNTLLDGDTYRKNDRFIKETKPMLWFINELIKRYKFALFYVELMRRRASLFPIRN